RLLREAAPDTPIVIFTGRGDEDIAVELMKTGAADYLPKASLSPERIEAAVRHGLAIVEAAAARQRAVDELRAQEAQFRTLANAIPQLAWMSDTRGNRYWVNQRWLDYTGASPDDPPDLLPFQHPDHRDRVEAGLRASFESGKPWEETHPLRAHDGSYRWFLSRALPIRAADNAITGWLGTSTDITDRMRAEELHAEAEKLGMVRRLAGGVAQEVNNAMTVVLGFSHFILQDGDVSSGHLADVLQIQRAADRAASVARQLLSYSRLVTPKSERVMLDATFAAMAPMIKRLLGTERRLVTRYDCGEYIEADVQYLEQMVTNLVLNARDAMPSGGTLTLSTRAGVVPAGLLDRVTSRAIPPGRYGLVSLADTGTGMDADVAAHIFEPFYTTKPVGQGTGLGLATLGGLLEESGGYVTVDTAPGRGTMFTLYFPLVAAAERPAQATASASGGAGILAGATVLIVDDEPAVRELARRGLEGSGCRVLEAADGSEAVDLVSRHGPPDLLLTDLMMRGMDGATLAERVRLRWPTLPILFMTGRLDQHDRIEAAVPEADMIEKPFMPEELVQRVYGALSGKS
ncbi:MAG TPA: response regulator, partial [Gemmatimonadales bacterium]|nr:response regulator [Gemmatimonadales bacterium]